MKKPTPCHLWQKDKLKPEDLYFEHFEIVKTFVDESHFERRILKCKDCGQLYFYDFNEWIDWEGGNDPQYYTFIPIEAIEEGEALSKVNYVDLLELSPRLHKDFLKEADKPKVYWAGKS